MTQREKFRVGGYVNNARNKLQGIEEFLFNSP